MEVRSAPEWLLVVVCIIGLWSILLIPIILFTMETSLAPDSMNTSKFNNSVCNLSNENSEDRCLEEFTNLSNSSVETTLACQRNFYFDKDFHGCVPSCGTWSELGETTTIALRGVILTCDLMGIILSILVIGISIKKHKLMFQFPTIFLVFSTVDILLMHLFVLIGYSNANLFCSSPTILNNTATPFCIISGMVFNYCQIQQSLWWIFHLFVIFWGVWFPFHYNKYKTSGRLRKVSVTLTTIGILAPILTIIITVSETAASVNSQPNVSIISKGLGYNSFTNLPILCSPDGISFYTYLIPLTILLAVGGPLIMLIIFRFCKSKTAGASDLKLILVLVYYVLLTCVNIINFIVIVKNVRPLTEALVSYLNCEREGLQLNDPCPREYEQYNLSYSITVLLFILALYPSYVLLFAVNITKLRKSVQDCICGHHLTNSPKTRSVVVSEAHL